MAVLEILCKFKTYIESFFLSFDQFNKQQRQNFFSQLLQKKKNNNLEMEKLPILMTSKDLRKKLDVNFKPWENLFSLMNPFRGKKIVYLSQTMSHMPVANEQSRQKKTKLIQGNAKRNHHNLAY